MRRSGPAPITLVCFAVKEEASLFRQALGSRNDLRLLITGMGRANAESRVREALARNRPGLVLTCGFAGGLRSDLSTGDVLYDTREPKQFGAALHSAGAKAGRFHCAERIAVTAEEKTLLRSSTGADAVEMESGFITAVCGAEGIPCVTLRVILDTAFEDLPLDFNKLLTPDCRIDGAKLALALAAAPGKIPRLLQFRRQTQKAAAQLATVLISFLNHGSHGSTRIC